MQHLHAVAIVVPDYDQAIEYYTQILGFDLIEDVPISTTKRWVLVRPKGGQTNILLARAADDQQSDAIGNQSGGRVFLFLHTDNFDGDYAAFHQRGVQFEESPRQEPYGQVAVFRDLYGNRWDLLQLDKTQS